MDNKNKKTKKSASSATKVAGLIDTVSASASYKENEKSEYGNLMKADIGITEKNRLAVSIELSKILADETVLYIKTKNAHWNVEGPDFYEKHIFFESQIKQLDEMIDQVAERIRFIGHYATATLKSYLSLTHLTEQTKMNNNGLGFVKLLLDDHESIIIKMRGKIKMIGSDHMDLGTADFVTGLMEKHEKMAWFLRSHLNK
jgi:starvation-inducible DNA-binding protein